MLMEQRAIDRKQKREALTKQYEQRREQERLEKERIKAE
jgi:hypothetical protein